MTWLDQFKKFYEEIYGQSADGDFLLAESYSIEADDIKLGALGCFYVDEAKKLDPDVEVDSALEMDYAEHKNHFLTIYSDVQIGGKHFRVVLEDTEYLNGRIAESQDEFERDSDYVVKRIISDYHHVLNHVNPNFDCDAYNPIKDPREC